MAETPTPQINLSQDSTSKDDKLNQVDPSSALQPTPTIVADNVQPIEHVTDCVGSQDSLKLKRENLELKVEIAKLSVQNAILQRDVMQKQVEITEVKVVLDQWGVDTSKNVCRFSDPLLSRTQLIIVS